MPNVPQSNRVSEGDSDNIRKAKLEVTEKVNVYDVAESTLKILRQLLENDSIPYYRAWLKKITPSKFE
jgi:hypothetical protein